MSSHPAQIRSKPPIVAGMSHSVAPRKSSPSVLPGYSLYETRWLAHGRLLLAQYVDDLITTLRLPILETNGHPACLLAQSARSSLSYAQGEGCKAIYSRLEVGVWVAQTVEGR